MNSESPESATASYLAGFHQFVGANAADPGKGLEYLDDASLADRLEFGGQLEHLGKADLPSFESSLDFGPLLAVGRGLRQRESTFLRGQRRQSHETSSRENLRRRNVLPAPSGVAAPY